MNSAIVLDCETTGLDSLTDRIVELAVVDWDTEENHWASLINPEMPIPKEATAVHNISDEDVVGKPVFREIADELSKRIESAPAVIGHNPYFDKGMVNSEFKRLNIHINWPILICTKRIWDIYEPREKRHLQNAYKRFVDRKGFEGAHGAMYDTLATKAVLKSQMIEFDLLNARWEELDPSAKTRWGASEHVIIVEDVLVFNIGKYKGTPCHLIDKSFWKWLVTKSFPEHVKMLADYLTIVKPQCSAQELYTWAYGALP